MATLPLMMGASLVSSIVGGLLGGKAANEQAAGAINASNAANSIQFGQQQLTRSDLAPYTDLGRQSSATLSNLLGIGPKPGTATLANPGALPQDIQDKVNKAAFLQKWLNGENPVGANGQPIGGAPSNAATRAKVQGELDQLNRDITVGKEMAANQASTASLQNGQDPNAFGSLMKDFTLADFNADPGYNFRLAEGQKALDRSAASKGGLFSGGTIKASDQYNQNFASNEFTNAYNRYQQNRATKFNQLATTAGIGQVSAGQVANLGQNTANNIAGNTAEGLTSAANARASSYTNWANSINSGINNAIGIYANRNMINNGGPSYSTPPFVGNGSTIPGTKIPTMPSLAYPRIN